jgi:hypothetical protein
MMGNIGRTRSKLMMLGWANKKVNRAATAFFAA